MTPSCDARTVSRFTRWARLASAAVVAVTLVVAAGWILDAPVLRRLHPSLPAMKLNAALSLAALGLALWFAVERPAHVRLRNALAGVALAISVVTLAECALGIDLGIDELVVRDSTDLADPGRMSPATASGILFIAAALVWLETRWAEWLTLLVALLAHIIVLGYLYGARDLYAIGPHTRVPLHSAAALYLLALGVLLARSQRGLMRIVASASPGGVLARRLLPAAFVLPAGLALLRQWGQEAGLYDTAFGRALVVAGNSAGFIALIWWTAAALARADARRSAAESAVREREQDLAITLESIADAVIATDESGRIKRMNAVAERLTGWPAGEALDRPLAEVFRITDEDTGAEVGNPVERVLREGVVLGLANHTLLTARDGTTRAIANSGAPIRNAQGVTRGVVMVFQDHTAERAAERRLRDSEARKAAVLESALDAIISIDASGTILEFNSAAEKMFGRARRDVIGKALLDAMVPPSVRDSQNRLARLATGESSLVGNRNDLVAYRADGSEFPVEISVSQVEQLDPPAFTVVLRDVTEPRRARAELMRSYDRLHVLAEVSDAVAAVATNYQLLLEKVARTIADIVGDSCLVMLVADDGEHLISVAQAHRDPALGRDLQGGLADVRIPRTTSSSVSATVARTGQPVRGDIEPGTMLAQTEEPLKPFLARLQVHSYAVMPIRARGGVIGTLSLVRSEPGRSYTEADLKLLQDIADRAGLAIDNARLYAQLEERVRARTAELEASNQELEAFSYSVAHDLRAPLRAISAFSEALVEDYADRLDPEGTKYITQIRVATHRMGRLIDDLLELSKISRATLRRAHIDISELARGVIARLRDSQPGRDVEVVIEPGLTAHADPRLLEVLLTNLLGNAWKFTGKRAHARIELAARPGERPTVYSVRDNGAGFDPVHAGKLFTAFQRLHPSDEFEGTGIGLAIVHRIIQRHGGRIWAEAAVDRGATFYFTLES